VGELVISITSKDVVNDAIAIDNYVRANFDLKPSQAIQIGITDSLVKDGDTINKIDKGEIDPSIAVDPTPLPIELAKAEEAPPTPDPGLLGGMMNAISNFFSNLFS
jgi:hypothetical protein